MTKKELLELAIRIDNLKDPDSNYYLYNQGIEDARNLLLYEAEKRGEVINDDI